jgi:hypothetical protein
MCAGNVRTVIASNGDLHPLRNLRMDLAETSIAPANVPEKRWGAIEIVGTPCDRAEIKSRLS